MPPKHGSMQESCEERNQRTNGDLLFSICFLKCLVVFGGVFGEGIWGCFGGMFVAFREVLWE